MCKEHQSTLKVINTYIDNGKDFTYDQLTDDIIKAKGILRTSIGVTIRMYLDRLQSIGLLVFDSKTGRYIVHKEVLEEQASLA